MPYLNRATQPKLAYAYTPPQPDCALPTLVFCSGYRSDMMGSKALYLEAWARQQGQGFLRFDYRGHGTSAGEFEAATIGDWTQDTLDMIDQITEQKPLVLVGSSMGGWIALLAALKRRKRVQGLVLIAPAPDFTRDLFYDRFPDEIKAKLDTQGYVELPNAYSDQPYYVSKALIDDGDTHRLLHRSIDFSGPVRILHGQADDAVPWQRSLTLAEQLASDDVQCHFLKGRDHRLSAPDELALLGRTTHHLCQALSR